MKQLLQYKNMTDKEKIKKLEKENEELKKKLVEKEKSSDNYSAWDFHWDGRGDYLEAQRCFYGDFS